MKSLLIANRGEIACRIIKSARRRGIRTVAVYSDADQQALHVKMADEAVRIGPAPAADSYLNIQQIIRAARSSGAQAIHPGYGFLSENPELVEACESAGIVFVGPSASAMRAMGLKDAAKRLMEDAGVPVVPGYHGESQVEALLLQQAEQMGFPVLIKARAGGGGKGMRKVNSARDFRAALSAAQRESQASFGDSHVLIEKYIVEPRHIEVQVFGDKFGNVVHLFERDCSLQRRHQKVMEEAPAPGMTDAVRDAMTQAAVAAAKAIDYYGAGTVEFIVDGSQALRTDGFWFMEMNTRLQVEHPVTEAITGVDLVDWQLRIADGEALPVSQEQLSINGHAVEVRLYAEDPASDFRPASGRLSRLRFAAEGRVDSGVQQGDEVTSYYDPLLAKLITHGDSRQQAFQRLASQLSATVVLGTQTNREFLWHLVSHADVLAGNFDTGFIDVHVHELSASVALCELAAMACVEWIDPAVSDPSETGPVARRLGTWQLWGAAQRQLELQCEGSTHRFELVRLTSPDETPGWQVTSMDMPGFPADGVSLWRVADERWSIASSQMSLEGRGTAVVCNTTIHVQLAGHAGRFQIPPIGLSADSATAADVVVSPMPGRVVAIHCTPGEAVVAGQALLSVEAMKMEQALCSDRDGVIEQISVNTGDQISAGKELVRLEALE